MSWFCEGMSETVVPVQINDLEDIALEWAVAFSLDKTSHSDFASRWPRIRMVQYDENGPWYLSAGWGQTNKNEPVHIWEPLSNWEQLGALIDQYKLSWNYTVRDHEYQRCHAFCPGNYDKGRAYAKDFKTAMLRALVNHLQPDVTLDIPIDILKVSKTFIDPAVKELFPEFPKPDAVEHVACQWVCDDF